MGLELWYQALPEGCALLERSLRDPKFGGFLTFPSRFHAPGPRPEWGGEDREFCEALEQLALTHPGLMTRHFTLDRYHDMIEYLISPARRQAGPAAPDLGTLAIRGAVELADHLEGGQGHRLRYTAPAQARAIARMLAAMTHDDLRAHFDPRSMEEAAVYKFFADRADAPLWGHICAYFDGLAGFYRRVAEHGEGVLVTVT